MGRALSKLDVQGVHTTADLHRAIMADETFRSSRITTKWLEERFLPVWEGER
jgi:acetyl-CoA carboxylase biotin carboxylase subunit